MGLSLAPWLLFSSYNYLRASYPLKALLIIVALLSLCFRMFVESFPSCVEACIREHARENMDYCRSCSVQQSGFPKGSLANARVVCRKIAIKTGMNGNYIIRKPHD